MSLCGECRYATNWRLLTSSKAGFAEKTTCQFSRQLGYIKTRYIRKGSIACKYFEPKCPVAYKPTFNKLMEKNKHTCQQVGAEHCDNTTEEVMHFPGGSFHTHPHGIPYPSETDLDTARRTNRPLMCIGMVPQKKTVCFNITEKTYSRMCEI